MKWKHGNASRGVWGGRSPPSKILFPFTPTQNYSSNNYSAAVTQWAVNMHMLYEMDTWKCKQGGLGGRSPPSKI